MESMIKHVYEPLQAPRDIRILNLLPSERFDDPVLVSLEVCKELPEPLKLLEALNKEYSKAKSRYEKARKAWHEAKAGYASDCRALGPFQAILQTGDSYSAAREHYRDASSDMKRLEAEHRKQDWEKYRQEKETHERNSNASYEAISYAWGDDTNTVPLMVIQKFWRSTLQIRPNVMDMLRYLRRPMDTRMLWVDALCINQSDIAEKEQQVRIMDQVYRKAERVLIWIGTEVGEKGAVELLFKTLSAPSYDYILHSLRYAYKELLASPQPIKETISGWLQGVLDRPWFQRRWIIQEVALGHEPYLLCGTHSVIFSRFVTRMTELLDEEIITLGLGPAQERQQSAVYRLQNIQGQRSDSYPNFCQPTMLELLVKYYAAECSDDRDRLFALNSLSSDPVPVNYSKSAEQVYYDYAKAEVTVRPGLLLSCGASFAATSDALPTWVPDWRSSPKFRPVSFMIDSARDDSNTTTPPTIESGILKIEAHERAKVGQVVNGDLNDFSSHEGDLAKVLQVWYDYFHQHCAQSSSSVRQDGDVIFVGAVTAGHVRLGQGRFVRLVPDFFKNPLAPATAARSKFILTYLSQLTDCQLTFGGKDVTSIRDDRVLFDYTPCSEDEMVPSHNDPDLSTNFHQVAAQLVPGRRCFFTEAGEFGMGPASMRVGDIIVTFPGSRTPIVLRSCTPQKAFCSQTQHSQDCISPLHAADDLTAQQRERFTVVGDSYIPDLIWSQPTPPTATLRTYNII
ncbi:HET-domain-containing protein [Trematosphaeria pertusa]|uniref:HET-domain-containing protein n=1 Tax=Trematosphaeria pertusa TaxID=390896 RepID=A0A6A6IKZ5_9PLEO|nr:HET-domain-containing protein [Trematosphaeria pertusa]KAF2251284.1 HET-domain-containing protein [Trematosphaeria pertusa]